MSNVMWLLSKSRPVLASFIAAGAALLPVLLIALHEITTVPAGITNVDQPDDAGMRGAGMFLAAAPFLYIAAVPICYAVGTFLARLGLRQLGKFLVGTTAVVLSLGVLAGIILSAPSRFGMSDMLMSIIACLTLFAVSAFPAATCWWFFAVRPHNTSVNTDAAKVPRRLP